MNVKRVRDLLLLTLATTAWAFGQGGPKTMVVLSSGTQVATAGATQTQGGPVVGAAYSATITNENVETLADGNRIVQTNTGMTARDSQGRTRQDAPLPMIGNLSPAKAPHLVFIQDPVAQTTYVLNLTDKTAQKMSLPGILPGGNAPGERAGPPAGGVFFLSGSAGAGTPPLPPPPNAVVTQKAILLNEPGQVETEELGTQTMEGVLASGVRTTRTIAAEAIGNEKPIIVVTEVWTSPELKTVVLSKRNDPRTGQQTFRLTNIVVGAPDPSLFTVPADFKITEGPQNFFYKTTTP